LIRAITPLRTSGDVFRSGGGGGLLDDPWFSDIWNPGSLFGESAVTTGQIQRMGMNMDVIERDDRYEVLCDVPGVMKENIRINTDNQTLTIEAQKEDSRQEEGFNYWRSERSTGRSRRTMSIPFGVALDQISAQCENGVLRVILPKQQEVRDGQKSIRID